MRRYCRGGLCQSNDNTLSGAFVRTGKGRSRLQLTICGRRDNCKGWSLKKLFCAVFVGDSVFTLYFMQWSALLSLQCLLVSVLATDTFPVCSHTITMMPEPIQSIMTDSRIESDMLANFFINRLQR